MIQRKLKSTILIVFFSVLTLSCKNDDVELRVQAEHLIIGEWDINSIRLITTFSSGSEVECYTGPGVNTQPIGFISFTDGKFGSFSNGSNCMGSTGFNSEVWTFEWSINTETSRLNLNSAQKGILNWRIETLSKKELVLTWEVDQETQSGQQLHNEYILTYIK
jgi:hypothetical protein